MSNDRISKGFKWAWSSRAVSLALNMAFIGYFTYYCTDIIGLTPTLVGTLLLITKIFDGVTDLIAGVLIDKTNTRWGKARPYQAFILPTWVLTILLFAIPDIGITGQSVYIIVLYTLIYAICATFLNASDAVCLFRCVRNENDRVSVTSFAGAATMFCAILFSIVMPQLIQRMGGTGSGWTMMAAVFGIPLGFIGLIRFFYCKETIEVDVAKEKASQVPLKESIKLLFKNKYIFIISFILFLFYIYNGISTAVNTYFYKYIMGNIGVASIIAIGNMITPILIMFVPKLTRKIGTVKFLRYGMVLGVLGLIIRIIGGTNIVTLFIGSIAAMIAILPITTLINIYIVDCMDYGEWKNGKRIDGLLSSVTAFSKKLGGGLASAGVGLIMGMAGYNGALETQTASANLSIVALYNYIPLVIFILMLIMSFVYNIDKIMPTMKKDLAAKHNKR